MGKHCPVAWWGPRVRGKAYSEEKTWGKVAVRSEAGTGHGDQAKELTMKEGRLLFVWVIVPAALVFYGIWCLISKLWAVIP